MLARPSGGADDQDANDHDADDQNIDHNSGGTMTLHRHRSHRVGPVLALFAAATLLGACGTQAAPPPAQAPGSFDDGVGRIAMSADGNQHDEDDWASAPMALAILAHRDLQPNLVHYDYNNHIWDSSQDHVENMTESVQEGGERFGFDMSRFFDDTDPQRLEAGTQNLVEEINASTEDDQLSIVLAGPIETVWMALNAADPEARTHVECVTHGDDSFNQTHGAEEHDGHDYEDLIDLGCERVEIPDQNSGLGPIEMDFWDFLTDSGDENWEWLYSRLDLVGNGDVSDAGMVFYVITGEEESDRSELKSYFQSGSGEATSE
ncbi:hypothetical protein CFP66_06800 [Pseudonocardia sp. MH-G8]|nr:hypothetical protein CFP66_06800 [Pseudonocardia sp. MH-G8]